jgi:hypothetical protein
LSPASVRFQHGFELGRHLGVAGLGVDDVAHLYQPGDVGTGAKPGVYTQDDGYWVGIALVIGLQLCQMHGQFGVFGLQTFQPLPMGCCSPLCLLQIPTHSLQLSLRSRQTTPCLGQLTVGLFLPGAVGGFQCSHLDFQSSNLFRQRL